MKKKLVIALACTLLMLSVSFAPTPALAQQFQIHRYITMGGQFITIPPLMFMSRLPWLTPGQLIQDIWFNIPWLPWVPQQPMRLGPGWWAVPIWVNNATLVGPNHITFWPTLGYVRLRTTAPYSAAGYGVIFIGDPWNGTYGCRGDVDVITFNNNTGIYWGSNPYTGQTSPRAGQLAMNPWNPLLTLDVGPDLIAGTGDDGFGDGNPDPPGSSIVYLYFRLYMDVWNGAAWVTLPGFIPISLLMTTGVAYDAVNQPGSLINGYDMMLMGHPWEFTATNPALWTNVTKSPKANVWVTYASVLSILMAPMGGMDILYGLWEKKVRADALMGDPVPPIPDITCDNVVNIIDVLAVANSFGSMDEGATAPPGYDPVAYGHSPPWPGPYPPATPAPWLVLATTSVIGDTFDARADLDNNGVINILDLVKVAVHFGESI